MDDATRRYRMKKDYEDARKKQKENPNTEESNFDQQWPLPPVEEERAKEESSAKRFDSTKEEKEFPYEDFLRQYNSDVQKQLDGMGSGYDDAALYDRLADASGKMMSIHGEEYKSGGPSALSVADRKAKDLNSRQEQQNRFVYDYLKRKQEASNPTKNMLRYMSVDVKDPVSNEFKKAVFDRQTGKYLSGGEGAFGVVKDRYENYEDYDPETKQTRTIMFDKILGKYFDTDGKPTTPKQKPPKGSATPKPLTYYDKKTNMFYQDVDGKPVAVKPGPEKRAPGGPKTPAPQKLTEGMKKAASFARRMEQAQQVIDGLEQSGFDPGGVTLGDWKNRAVSGIGLSMFADPKFQQYQAAKLAFINAVLRDETGAAIAANEKENKEKELFPQPGDDPQTVANKRAARLQALEAMRASAESAYDLTPSVPTPRVGEKQKYKVGDTVERNGKKYKLNALPSNKKENWERLP
jgi:hypothetical protein